MLDRILAALPALPPAEQRVAKLVLADARSFASLPVSELAERSHVSKPTVIRFCRSVGYDGLADFKLKLAGAVNEGVPFVHRAVDEDDKSGDIVVKIIDNAVSAPADDNRIGTVTIYRADQNGVAIAGEASTYTRGGTTTCALPDGTSMTVPYTPSGPQGYPPSSRCNYLSGCILLNRSALDTIGVRVTYTHQWITPLGGFPGPGFGGQGGTGFTLTQSNAMRMEPVL